MDVVVPGPQHAGMDDLGTVVLVAGVFLLAGAVKGVAGMGLPTLAMALLSLRLAPVQAAALMLLPSLATNIAQCLGPHARTLFKRLWPLWLGLVAACVASPWPDLGAAGPAAQVLLGAVLVIYGLWGWGRPVLPDWGPHRAAVGAVAGVAAGLLTATTGVFVMPLVPYLQSLKLGREEMIQALGLSFLMATLALAWRLGPSRLWPAAGEPWWLALALGAAFIGLGLGARWRRRLAPATFQRVLYAVFVLLGALIAGRALRA
jgi:uncharacterized membrane protein YfcA